MTPSSNVLPIVVLGAAAIATFTDVSRFKVYNLLTYPVFFGGVFYHGLLDGWGGLAFSLGGAGFGFVLLLVPYLLGGLGAGDVKFVVALGAWLGSLLIVPVVVIGCLTTGLYALVLVVRAGGLRGLWLNTQITCARFVSLGRLLSADDCSEVLRKCPDDNARRRRLIPFSAMISLGALATIALAMVLGAAKP